MSHLKARTAHNVGCIVATLQTGDPNEKLVGSVPMNAWVNMRLWVSSIL
jgi:hypothetical protein